MEKSWTIEELIERLTEIKSMVSPNSAIQIEINGLTHWGFEIEIVDYHNGKNKCQEIYFAHYDEE